MILLQKCSICNFLLSKCLSLQERTKRKRKSNEHFFCNSNIFDNNEVEMPELVKMRIWHLSKELTKLRVPSLSFYPFQNLRISTSFLTLCVTQQGSKKGKMCILDMSIFLKIWQFLNDYLSNRSLPRREENIKLSFPYLPTEPWNFL